MIESKVSAVANDREVNLTWFLQENGFTMDSWAEMKKTTPFGQLPLLEAGGFQIAQCVAIGPLRATFDCADGCYVTCTVNYVGRKASMDGGDNLADFVTSQMLMGEGEDLYAAMQKFVPTVRRCLGCRYQCLIAACGIVVLLCTGHCGKRWAQEERQSSVRKLVG